MTPTAIGAAVLACAVVLALAAGLVMRARSGRIRGTDDAAAGAQRSGEVRMLRAAGMPDDGPCVVHFSADWCGPCGAVRRVVRDAVARLDAEGGAPVHDLELDLDEHAELARELRVMSLPTTFLYDSAGRRHARIPGVPTAPALTDALRALR